VIRLGSLAGYPFDGPRLLAGWTPPPVAAVYAIMYKPEPEKENYAVIYVGHADDLSAQRFPFKHPRAACWIQRAGSKWKVYVCSYEVPGGTRAHDLGDLGYRPGLRVGRMNIKVPGYASSVGSRRYQDQRLSRGAGRGHGA
jgi:hypothetical protein